MTKIVEIPHSKESEMMVLGCMLNSIHDLDVCSKSLSTEDFYHLQHQTIFSCLKLAFLANKQADIHLISEELKRQEKLEFIGGVSYLTTLAQFAGTSAFIEGYVGVLKNKSSLRKLIYTAQQIVKEALEAPSDTTVLMGQSIERLKTVQKDSIAKNKFQIKFLHEFDDNFLLSAPPLKEMLLECIDDKGSQKGFLPKGIVAMLVGAGGLGKTHLLVQIAVSIATGIPLLEFFATTECCGVEKRGNVFLGLGENQYGDIHRILYKSAKELRKDTSKTNLLLEASQRIAIFSFSGQQSSFLDGDRVSQSFRELKYRLIELAPKNGGWTLIILDPISRFLGADAETDNAAATQFITLMEELTIELPGNPTVLFAHHVNKASLSQELTDQTASRGSSALTDGVRWQANLVKVPEKEKTVIFKMTKSNFTAIFRELHLEKDEEGNLHLLEKRQNILSGRQVINARGH